MNYSKCYSFRKVFCKLNLHKFMKCCDDSALFCIFLFKVRMFSNLRRSSGEIVSLHCLDFPRWAKMDLTHFPHTGQETVSSSKLSLSFSSIFTNVSMYTDQYNSFYDTVAKLLDSCLKYTVIMIVHPQLIPTGCPQKGKDICCMMDTLDTDIIICNSNYLKIKH